MKKGFTLIELLVVISIIGLLSSVALASLGSSRVRAADAAIRADLVGIRAGAQIDYDTFRGRYNTTGVAVQTNVCSTVSTAGTILANANKAILHIKATNGNLDGQCNIDASGTAYAIVFPLRSTGKFWCIDSLGVSRGKTSAGNDYDALTGAGNAALGLILDTTCN